MAVSKKCITFAAHLKNQVPDGGRNPGQVFIKAIMKTYIYSITKIEEGNLDYSGVLDVFTDKETAKKFVTKEIKEQAYFWGVTPTIYKAIKGSFVQYEVKHKEKELTMYFTLQVINK